MQGMDYFNRIVRDPQVCGGQPVVRGTRVPLRTILASLAEGATVAEILTDFPTLREDDVRAVIAFAAAAATDDLPVPGIPTSG
jgi:uncharacterized protein (DUF433 family)